MQQNRITWLIYQCKHRNIKGVQTLLSLTAGNKFIERGSVGDQFGDCIYSRKYLYKYVH